VLFQGGGGVKFDHKNGGRLDIGIVHREFSFEDEKQLDRRIRMILSLICLAISNWFGGRDVVFLCWVSIFEFGRGGVG